MTTFGEWVAAERTRRKLFSQGAFAKKAKVGRSSIQAIEDDQGFAHRQWRIKDAVASALGRDVFELEQIEESFKKQAGGKVERPRLVVIPEVAYAGLAEDAATLGFPSVEAWLTALGTTLRDQVTRQASPAGPPAAASKPDRARGGSTVAV